MSKPHAVIIPAYRPDTRLIRLVAEVLDLGYSVIVVNDGSGDAYDSVFRALDPRVNRKSAITAILTSCPAVCVSVL